MHANGSWSKTATREQSSELSVPYAIIKTLYKDPTRFSDHRSMAEINRKACRALGVDRLYRWDRVRIDGRIVWLWLIVVGVLVGGLHGLHGLCRYQVRSRGHSASITKDLIDSVHINTGLPRRVTSVSDAEVAVAIALEEIPIAGAETCCKDVDDYLLGIGI